MCVPEYLSGLTRAVKRPMNIRNNTVYVKNERKHAKNNWIDPRTSALSEYPIVRINRSTYMFHIQHIHGCCTVTSQNPEQNESRNEVDMLNGIGRNISASLDWVII